MKVTGKLGEERSSVARRLRLVALDRVPSNWLRPFQSLPSRIILSVFGAALVSSLVITWISTQSTEAFLRAKIDEKFPAILRSAGERLELWYGQRELDIQTLAGSATVADNLVRVARAGAGPRSARARKEIQNYLEYVMEGFPQYEALFVLDAKGEPLAWVGREVPIPEGRRRELAAVSAPSVGDVRGVGAHRFQVASAPVKDYRVSPLGSLHGMVGIESLEGLLHTDELGGTGGVYLLTREGTPLAGVRDLTLQGPQEGPQPAADGPPVATEYTNGAGLLVVGSAVSFPRFGWTIVVEEPYEQAFAPVVALIHKILRINLAIVLAFGLIAFWLARSVVRPILALSAKALDVATGQIDVDLPISSRQDEIGVLTRAFKEMLTRLQRNRHELSEKQLEIQKVNLRLLSQNQELQRVKEVFEQLSITDGLTKLHNHRFFHDHLPGEMKRAKRSGEPLSLIVIDIDDFKKLNDRFGHAVGDVVLRGVAEVMRELVRESDLLARYGGEEFALLAIQTPLEGALILAEKIRSEVRGTRFSADDLDGPTTITITVSIGVAAFRGDEKAFFNDADRALYRAKASGKDCVITSEEC